MTFQNQFVSGSAVQHYIILITVMQLLLNSSGFYFTMSHSAFWVKHETTLGERGVQIHFCRLIQNHAPIKHAHTKTRPSTVAPPVLSRCQCNGHGCGTVRVFSGSMFSRKAVFRNNKPCYQYKITQILLLCALLI